LAELVRQGAFRQDLYYRLNVIPIQMPSLRELREDIPEIAQQILGRLQADASVRFSEKALQALQDYSFPGNVRELENIIERALALCSGGVIEVQDLLLVPVEQSQSDNAFPDRTSLSSKYPLTKYLDEVEKQALLEALKETGFNRTAAAKLLGLTFRTMRYRMERLAIKASHGSDDED
jgi:two-component system response regulator PilR (NtrC family)